jgi:ketosteroid isomerase-like protein
MTEPSTETVVHEYGAALASGDQAALGRLRHADWTSDWPQSGERLRGHARAVALDGAYPGGRPSVSPQRTVGSEDRWVMTPLYQLQRIVGTGDSWWADGTVSYPDGSVWQLAMLLELRDGRIHRETTYFAEPFEAPAWRAPFVERIEP